MTDLKEKFRNWLIKQELSEKTPSGKQSTVYDYIKTIDRICKNEDYITWDELASNIFSIIDNYQGKSLSALNKYNEFLFVVDIPYYIHQQRNEWILNALSIDEENGKIILDDDQDFFTPGEVSKILRVSLRTLQRWRQNKIGPSYRQDNHTGKITYPKPYFEKYINESMKKI